MKTKTRLVFFLLSIVLAFASRSARADGPIEVEPADLARRRDLIGKEIVIDDRVKMFLPAPEARGYNKILLKRTDVVLLLPPEFSYTTSQSQKAVRAKGILRQDEAGLFLEVNARPELFADDVKRLKKVVALFPLEDAESRSAWGDWATKRAAAFNDSQLRAMAETLQAEAIALELRKPTTRTPEAILAIARKARAKGVPEPEPSALAHLGFRVRMASAKTTADFEKIADEILAYLPRAKSAANAIPSLRTEEYLKDPAVVYRRESEENRAALDRRLWTDAFAESIRVRGEGASPARLRELADLAQAQLPDRKEIGGELRRRALEAEVGDVTSLGESEMHDLEKTYRYDLKKPREADALVRRWLEFRRDRLSPTNAEDRVIYAGKYLEFLKDKAAAADLLSAALKIDPDCAPAVSLFQRMGYLKVNGSWRDPNGSPVPVPIGEGSDRPSPKDDALLGLTPAEVKAQLGEPKRTSRVVTQGRVSIQWVYEGARGSQFIDFLHRAGDAHPIVVGHFSAR